MCCRFLITKHIVEINKHDKQIRQYYNKYHVIISTYYYSTRVTLD